MAAWQQHANGRVGSQVHSLTLHQLQIFAAVVREGSFTKAAQSLFLSEPTVSEQIKLLEQVVGASLFSRAARKPIRVTTAGERLLEAVDQVSNQLEEALRDIASLQRAEAGRIAFGAGRAFGAYIFPSLYASFRDANPGISVQVDFAVRQRLLESVLKRELDLAVVLGHDGESGLNWTPLSTSQLVPVGAVQHPWAQGPAVPFRRLAEERIIIGGPASSLRAALERKAVKLGIQLQLAWEVHDPEAKVQAAASGLGITIVPQFIAAPRVAAGACSLLHVEGFPLTLGWFIVNTERELTRPVQAFKNFLLSRQVDIEKMMATVNETATWYE